MQEFVVLVDQNDQQIGVEEKLSAHRQGLLHRAFSIFLFNPEGRMLIHQRALHKYHSGGLWTNACCSHPRPGEEVADAAKRRLQEELGISCALEKQFSFIYKVHLVEDGLYEHEFDHVFI
ncbi:isopentenyl-diphosphate Delta-isomerase, partial [bacterium]|nr:isopentenyl-diphosphate Delta-isomerase [bacterium]